jgi:uncharacterized DUF497 family protein
VDALAFRRLIRFVRPTSSSASLGDQGKLRGHTGRGSINTRLSLDERLYQFEWDEAKAAGILLKHGISFELASSIFADPGLLTVADMEHSAVEDRWFSIGLASDGKLLSIAYTWSESEPPMTKIRLISARRATSAEISHYEENR